MADSVNEKRLSVRQIARQIDVDPHALLETLRGPNHNYKIASVDSRLGSLTADTILEEHAKNGSFTVETNRNDSESEGSGKPSRKNLNSNYKDGHAFEAAVGEFIHAQLPNSHLSNVFLFLAERLSTTDKYGREIDHLLHLRRGTEHRLVIVECKHSNLELEGRNSVLQDKDWIVETTAGRKEVRKQMWLQARALLQLLKPIPEVDLVIEAIALLSDTEAENIQDISGRDDPRVHYRVMGFHDFESYLHQMSETHEYFRVGQSEFLRRLRQGMRCTQLGHPDIRDAIDYHRRSRQTLDYGLFEHFKPTKGKWAINGTAGMGKSVLLAYALCAFSTDQKLVLQKNGSLKLVPAKLEEKELPPLKKRKIVVFSLKEKQRKIIEYFFRYFIGDFQAHDIDNVLRIQRPKIKRWRLGEEIDGNVVLIDEAHDLSEEAQKKITLWLNGDPDNRYLVIACDRHQKLRLIGDSDHKRMIAGLHFGRHTKALKRVYRNPFSVYAAGLGLMFRWFAPDGAKVVPDQAQLKKDFGFKVNSRSDEKGGLCDFEMTEDAHPGNHWHHCVSNFPDADTAQSWLAQYHLEHDDVLWVRFNNEDPDFDYEQLQHYQYHNLHTSESVNIIDKYIKGQEFPVVIIEGVGDDFNNFDDEERMFAHRRELYLCASRATVFLFFIYSGAQGGAEPVSQELEALRKKLALPIEESKSSQRWGFQFNIHDKAIPLSQFEDLVDPLEGLGESDAEKERKLEEDEADAADEDSLERENEQVADPGKDARDSVQESDKRDKDSVNHDPVEHESKGLLGLSEAVKEKFADAVDESRLQTRMDGKRYTPIDFYTVETLAHYLAVEKSELEGLLQSYDLSPDSDRRIPYTTVVRVTKELDIPEPWNHPEYAEKPNRVFVEFNGQPLRRDTAARKLSAFFADQGADLKTVRSALQEVFKDREGAKEEISLIDFAKLVNRMKVNADHALSVIRPSETVSKRVSGSAKEQPPSNPSGHSVLDVYTPRKLAEYLDIKPFKVMAELLKDPKVMNLTLNQEVSLETVEKICTTFEKSFPWDHETQGNHVPEIMIWDKVLKSDNQLAQIITKIYKGRRGVRSNILLERIEKSGVVNHSSVQSISATQLYELLKALKLKPEVMLQKVEAAKPTSSIDD